MIRIIPIPTSTSADRIKQIAETLDFVLGAQDMEDLNGLEIGDSAAASTAALKEVRGP